MYDDMIRDINTAGSFVKLTRNTYSSTEMKNLSRRSSISLFFSILSPAEAGNRKKDIPKSRSSWRLCDISHLEVDNAI
jgi:hypothetical protein